MDITKITTSPPNPVTVNNEVPGKGKNPFWTARRVRILKICVATVVAVAAITAAVACPLIFACGLSIFHGCLIGATAGISTALLAGLGIYFGRNLGQLTINPTNTPYRRIVEEAAKEAEEAKQKPEPNPIDLRSRWINSFSEQEKAKDLTNPPYRTIIDKAAADKAAADKAAADKAAADKAAADKAAADKAAADKAAQRTVENFLSLPRSKQADAFNNALDEMSSDKFKSICSFLSSLSIDDRKKITTTLRLETKAHRSKHKKSNEPKQQKNEEKNTVKRNRFGFFKSFW